MEMIKEDDDSFQSGQPSSPIVPSEEKKKEKVVDMKMSVRRRFWTVCCQIMDDSDDRNDVPII